MRIYHFPIVCPGSGVVFDYIDSLSYVVISDTLFLLAFLRVSKFSQLKARERIGNFFFHLNRDVYYLKGCDPIKAEQLDIIKE